MVGDSRPTPPENEVSESKLRGYVDIYFEHVHPLYPFLDRRTFEASFLNVQTRDTRPAFRALYHSVLALGCQYVGEDTSFALGQGEAWSYFRIALSLVQDIVFPPEALLNLQVCGRLRNQLNVPT